MVLVIFMLLAGAVFFRLPYMSYTGDRIVFTPLGIDLTQVDFAGERLPLDPHVNPF
jgi:hypothetical protein